MSLDRREFLRAAMAATLVPSLRGLPSRSPLALQDRPRPSMGQLEWQRDELAMFFHFGMNTFTNREWGDGKEDPRIFDPKLLDARQWTSTARATGFRTVILTAKHHDGFCLWPTRTTRHSVASTPWRNGRGDLVREFVDAARADGLKVGLYLSPWDRNHPTYGDSPAYNAVYWEQMTELLTQYGSVHEVWFDGANAEGPNGRRQVYDWSRTWDLVRRLQPNAVMFSDAGPDIRWIGNESGAAGITNWSTVDPSIVTRPGMEGDEVMRSLREGDRTGTVWRPGETDVSIRPGWFYHASEDERVRRPENLVELYFSSVGRNSKLLLNVPPTTDGLLHELDVRALRGMRGLLDDTFSVNVSQGVEPAFRVMSDRIALSELVLPAARRVGIIDLREDIAQGQRVARYRIEAHDGSAWAEVARGTTIGYRKLERITPQPVQRLRVTVEDAAERPLPLAINLFSVP